MASQEGLALIRSTRGDERFMFIVELFMLLIFKLKLLSTMLFEDVLVEQTC